jgi:hypothetical protein
LLHSPYYKSKLENQIFSKKRKEIALLSVQEKETPQFLIERILVPSETNFAFFQEIRQRFLFFQ